MIEAAGIATALAVLAVGTASAPGPWILTCNMGQANEPPASPQGQRVFRVGRHLFQEWRPAEQRFGPNLCAAHSCAGAGERLEGTISSSTVSLTVSLDPATGRATWRTLGASGLRTTSGTCSVKAEQADSGPGTSTSRRAPGE